MIKRVDEALNGLGKETNQFAEQMLLSPISDYRSRIDGLLRYPVASTYHVVTAGIGAVKDTAVGAAKTVLKTPFLPFRKR